MKTLTTAFATTLCVLAGAASANLVSSFGFTELNASFDLNSGVFSAVADSANGLATTGDVTAYGPGTSTAIFQPGFFTGGSLANADFRMDIISTDGINAVASNGRILITDADGDNLAGSFEGTWELRFGFAFFNGEITSAQFNSGGGNGTFDGPGGGSFGNPDGALIGALNVLMFQMGQNLFTQSFDNRSATVTGMLVPAPGAMALLGLGGLIATRRRR